MHQFAQIMQISHQYEQNVMFQLNKIKRYLICLFYTKKWLIDGVIFIKWGYIYDLSDRLISKIDQYGFGQGNSFLIKCMSSYAWSKAHASA